MGRPFQSEISRLAWTYEWSLSLDISGIAERVRSLSSSPLLVVGSGGSQSTAALIGDLHQRECGQLAKADTPLLASSYLGKLTSTAIFLVSASGKNPDILGVAKNAVESEPNSIIALCATKRSPLASIVNSFGRGFSFEFELPGGKDGFLATNSLVALSTIALRMYGHDLKELPRAFEGNRDWIQVFDRPKNSAAIRSFFEKRYLIALYGGQSRSAALDLESKLVEAGLVSVQLADYRNFAHGRHHWLAKNPDTAVVALASREEADLAQRTLALLPRTIPAVLLSAKLAGVGSWVALQAAVFDFVAKYGETRRIDPGRPGVPEFGRRIYHLNAFRPSKIAINSVAVERKVKASQQQNRTRLEALEVPFAEVCDRLGTAKFQGLVLDYDGTICDSVDRFGDIPPTTAKAISRITEAGFLLGVATGRGKSVRIALRKALPRSHWPLVQVGYYNGGVVAPLENDREPDTDKPIPASLQLAAEALKSIKRVKLVLSVRPQQVTIEAATPMKVADLWRRVLQCLEEARIEGLKTVVSTRSVDVIPKTTSKLTLLRMLSELVPDSTFLCIGDRPKWPGNDAELLSHRFSLSVDEVDDDPGGVWNLAPAGVVGAAALRYYLARVKVRGGYFRLRLETDERSAR